MSGAPKLLKPGLSRVKPDRLFIHPLNDRVRTIRPDRLDDAVFNLLARPEMLRARPIITNLEGAIVGGARRWLAVRRIFDDVHGVPWGPFHEAYKAGVPVYARAFPDDAELREWITADNADFGEWIPDELAALVSEHARAGADTRLLGLADEDVRHLIAMHEGAGDPGPDPGEAQGDSRPTFGRKVTCPACGLDFHIDA
jgi:hypothetical protein